MSGGALLQGRGTKIGIDQGLNWLKTSSRITYCFYFLLVRSAKNQARLHSKVWD